jgi:uncharacterized membrane protein
MSVDACARTFAKRRFDAILRTFRGEGSMRCLATIATVAILLFASSGARAADISVCNDFRARIHVAFGYQNQRNIPASGWWVIEPNVCQKVEFVYQGSTIYYTAESDDYADGSATSHDHWGNKISLFVTNTRFDVDDAQAPRSGATTKMFSLYEIPPQFLGKPASIVFHFRSRNTDINITLNN